MKLKYANNWVAMLVGLFFWIGYGLAYGLEVKPDAPTKYIVKKNDTLWDISKMFLDKPWLWPELWRNNTQILNPHLIYPGDTLVLRFVDGEPVLEIVREKTKIALSPSAQRTIKNDAPINLLPWSMLKPYIQHHEIIDRGKYKILPHLLGDKNGSIRFIDEDLVMSRRSGRAKDQYRVVRKNSKITDLDGNVLGVQIHHIANASMVEDRAAGEWLVKIKDSNTEAKRGDKLLAGKPKVPKDMVLQPASKLQRGFIVNNLHQHELLGKYDVAIVDLGEDEIEPGTVMGIYQQGPTIIDDGEPKYATDGKVFVSVFDDGSTVEQPALKVGELVIFSTFTKASYGIIVRAHDMVRTGNIVAQP